MQSISLQKNSPSAARNTILWYGMLCLSVACIAFMFYTGSARNPSSLDAVNTPTTPPPSGNQTPTVVNGTVGTTSNEAVSQVVTDALAFYNMLNTTQQASLQLSYSTSLARKWSNLPCGSSCRNGVQFGTLSPTQLAAAYKVIADALGNTPGDGADEFYQTTMAEAYLHANGGGTGYDSTLRWIAFLNTPSATGPWMLQFGGHHYAANIAFNNGHVIGATPFFMGVEPKSFTWNSTVMAPLTDEHDAFANMLASLTSSQLTTAKLTSSFSDCTLIPGETNGGKSAFPSPKVGVPCSALSTDQKALVLGVIWHYVQDMDSATAATVLSGYTNELDQTYIAFAGSGTSGNAGSFLSAQGNYGRIDGPGVWIEFSCQGGVVIQGQIHYHTVWRDHNHDYGVDLTGAAIDVPSSSGVASPAGDSKSLSLFPNPATRQVIARLPIVAKDARVTFIDVDGRVVKEINHISGSNFSADVSELTTGVYIMRVEERGSVFTGKFRKL